MLPDVSMVRVTRSAPLQTAAREEPLIFRPGIDERSLCSDAAVGPALYRDWAVEGRRLTGVAASDSLDNMRSLN